jgi:Tol biopolymer transport system component
MWANVTEVDVTGLDFLSNEPIEGELLAERMTRGGITDEEALQCAIEIGSLLKRAHVRGIVHGALSPYSVAVTPAGARILQPPQEPDPRAARFRAPEQVLREEADWRTDIFSYGTLVYEMATGRPAFTGEGTDLDRAIVEDAPRNANGSSPVRAAMEGVIASCLEKEPAKRRQRIQNAVIELKLVGRSLAKLAKARRQTVKSARVAGVAAPVQTPPRMPVRPQTIPAYPEIGAPRAKRDVVPIMIAGFLAVAAAALAVLMFLRLHQSGQKEQVMNLPLMAPEHTTYPGMPSISPDGKYLALSAEGPDRKRMLWLRPLEDPHSTVIPETEDGFAAFWSPDSEQMAYFANQSLKRISVKGGHAQTICEATATASGGTWSKDGVILFAPSLGEGLYRVQAGGGVPQPVLRLNPAKWERAFEWPQFLPDGKHFIFFVQTEMVETTGIYLGSIDSAEYHQLLHSETNAVYSAGGPAAPKKGYLLFIRDKTIKAQPLDMSHFELDGDEIPLVADVGAVSSLALAPISVSANNTLVYQTVGQVTRQMAWVDRTGRQIGVAGEPGEYGPPRISPDGRRAVVAKLGPDHKNADLWMLDSGGVSRFTDTPWHEGSPIWSPDGSRIVYFSNQEGGIYNLYAKAVNGGKTELLFKNSARKFPTDWSKDGKYILFGSMTAEGTRLDIWGLTMPGKQAAPIVDTVYNEGSASLSPDGKFMSFQSDESRRIEVYVQLFEGLSDGTKPRWQVSKGGGGLPQWRADGGELFYITPSGRMMATAVHTNGGKFSFDEPHMLFQTRPVPGTWNFFDVTPDGQRFLMNLPLEWSEASPINVLTNWTEEIKAQ